MLLAVVSLLIGILTITTATSTLLAFTGSRDAFTKGVVESDAKLYLPMIADGDKAVEAKNHADLEPISTRKAQTLWDRRNVLLPLAGIGLIVGVLLTLGAPRATWGAPTRRTWGRSAWQLGAMLGVLAEGLEAVASRAESRDLAAKIADLGSPLAMQLRAISETWMPVLLQAVAALLLASAAIYLSGADARAFAEQKG